MYDTATRSGYGRKILGGFDQNQHLAFFWARIIAVRTAATNIGDISGDLKLTRPLVLVALVLFLSVLVFGWMLFNKRHLIIEWAVLQQSASHEVRGPPIPQS